jgi:hypothetical protein
MDTFALEIGRQVGRFVRLRDRHLAAWRIEDATRAGEWIARLGEAGASQACRILWRCWPTNEKASHGIVGTVVARFGPREVDRIRPQWVGDPAVAADRYVAQRGVRGAVLLPSWGEARSCVGLLFCDLAEEFREMFARPLGADDVGPVRRSFGRLMDQAARWVHSRGYDLDDSDCTRLVGIKLGAVKWVPFDELTAGRAAGRIVAAAVRAVVARRPPRVDIA